LARRAQRSAEKLTGPSDVLDVGCGDGRFLKAMRDRGHRIFGTEMPGPAYERAARVNGIELQAPPLSGTSFPGRRFALVTAWHVLEHVPDPDRLVDSIRHLLLDDGTLIVEVPNASSWHGRATGPWSFSLDPPRHLHQFSRQSLVTMLRKHGFEVTQVDTTSIEMGVMGVVQSFLNCLIQPRDLFYDLLRSRGRCPGRLSAKAAAIALAIPLIPVAFAWTLVESAVGRGPVLRATCCLATRNQSSCTIPELPGEPRPASASPSVQTSANPLIEPET
jgi:SAM-dependent methyltransferase